jgi:hypothetical protein
MDSCDQIVQFAVRPSLKVITFGQSLRHVLQRRHDAAPGAVLSRPI